MRRKGRANQWANDVLKAHGEKPKPKPKRPRSKPVPQGMTAEKTNAAGEKVLRQYGTTKRSKDNPVRLTDGWVHPVTVRRIDDA